MCHTCFEWPTRIQKRSRTPSTAVAASSTADSRGSGFHVTFPRWPISLLRCSRKRCSTRDSWVTTRRL